MTNDNKKIQNETKLKISSVFTRKDNNKRIFSLQRSLLLFLFFSSQISAVVTMQPVLICLEWSYELPQE